jgi:hypothetical protein
MNRYLNYLYTYTLCNTEKKEIKINQKKITDI